MNKEQLKINTVYYWKQRGVDCHWIIRITSLDAGRVLGPALDIEQDKKGRTLRTRSDNWWGTITDIDFDDCRLATQQEIDHLDACIKAGKYVEVEQVKELFLI